MQVLITGTSRGIGQALAGEFLRRGDRVMGLGRTPPEKCEPVTSFYRAVDLSQLDSIAVELRQLLEQAKCQELDLVILNAGILGQIADLRDTPMADLKRLMDVNLWANKIVLDTIFASCNPVRQVVAISSGAAVNGNRGWGGYSLSKAALNMLIRLLAAEQPATHCSALAPGLVDTAMQDYLCGQSHDQRFEAVQRISAKRNTSEMPAPAELAPRLIEVIEQIPNQIPSGEFVDIRNLKEQIAPTS